jgi:hypothetical protein
MTMSVSVRMGLSRTLDETGVGAVLATETTQSTGVASVFVGLPSRNRPDRRTIGV